MEKCAKTINLLLYINEFQSEALDHNLDKVNIKLLDDLEEKVNSYLDKKENAPDEYFQILNDVNNKIFEQNGIEIHTVDQIFYEIALEYNIYEEDDYNLYNQFINSKIKR